MSEDKFKKLVSVQINNSAVATMSDGSLKTREQILTILNLDPNTSPDAWLSIFGCGVNSIALKPRDALNLVKTGAIKETQLSESQLKALRDIR